MRKAASGSNAAPVSGSASPRRIRGVVLFVTPEGKPALHLAVYVEDGRRAIRTDAKGKVYWSGVKSNYLWDRPNVGIADKNWTWRQDVAHFPEDSEEEIRRRFVEQGEMHHRVVVARRSEIATFYYRILDVHGKSAPNYRLELHRIGGRAEKPVALGNVFPIVAPGRYRLWLGKGSRGKWLPETLTLRAGQSASRRITVHE